MQSVERSNRTNSYRIAKTWARGNRRANKAADASRLYSLYLELFPLRWGSRDKLTTQKVESRGHCFEPCALAPLLAAKGHIHTFTRTHASRRAHWNQFLRSSCMRAVKHLNWCHPFLHGPLHPFPVVLGICKEFSQRKVQQSQLIKRPKQSIGRVRKVVPPTEPSLSSATGR